MLTFVLTRIAHQNWWRFQFNSSASCQLQYHRVISRTSFSTQAKAAVRKHQRLNKNCRQPKLLQTYHQQTLKLVKELLKIV